MWKSGSLICKSFHSQVFHNKLLNALFIFLFNFLFSRSRFRFYSIYLIMCKICDKNISNQKYGKLRNCLFKMKNWIKLFLKRPLCLNKRTSLFGKRAPGLFRRTDGDRIPPNWRLFLTLLVQIKKSVFFFNEASDPWTLYLSKIGPDWQGLPELPSGRTMKVFESPAQKFKWATLLVLGYQNCLKITKWLWMK